MGYNTGIFAINEQMERKMMKKTLILIVAGALLLSACAPKMGDTIEQAMNMVEELVTEENNQAEMMEDKPMESEASGQEYVTWDYYNFPDQFPEYSDGRIQKPFMTQDWYPIIIGIEGSSVQAIEEYVQRALQAGYSLQWEREVMGDEDLGWAVSMETDEENFSIILNYYEDFSGIPDYVSLLLDVREKQQ